MMIVKLIGPRVTQKAIPWESWGIVEIRWTKMGKSHPKCVQHHSIGWSFKLNRKKKENCILISASWFWMQYKNYLNSCHHDIPRWCCAPLKWESQYILSSVSCFCWGILSQYNTSDCDKNITLGQLLKADVGIKEQVLRYVPRLSSSAGGFPRSFKKRFPNLVVAPKWLPKTQLSFFIFN